MARGNFGERLKRERELREVTLEEITSATRIGPRFLEALENEDWEKLPGGIFNRGFVRSIARYLGLDEEALLGEYDMAHNAQVQAASERPENPIPSPPRWLPIAFVLGALALLAALVAAGIFGWRYYQARKARTSSANSQSAALPPLATPSAPSATDSSSIPASAAPASVSDSNNAPLDLSVATRSPAHPRFAADDAVVFDQDLQPGRDLHFSAARGFQVSASDSSAVLLELNGRAVPPLGLPGSSGTIRLSYNDLR